MAVKFQLASAQLPLILVKVAVSGKNAQRIVTAILDTGATSCVIAQSLATELELPHSMCRKVKSQRTESAAKLKLRLSKSTRLRLMALQSKI